MKIVALVYGLVALAGGFYVVRNYEDIFARTIELNRELWGAWSRVKRPRSARIMLGVGFAIMAMGAIGLVVGVFTPWT